MQKFIIKSKQYAKNVSIQKKLNKQLQTRLLEELRERGEWAIPIFRHDTKGGMDGIITVINDVTYIIYPYKKREDYNYANLKWIEKPVMGQFERAYKKYLEDKFDPYTLLIAIQWNEKEIYLFPSHRARNVVAKNLNEFSKSKLIYWGMEWKQWLKGDYDYLHKG